MEKELIVKALEGASLETEFQLLCMGFVKSQGYGFVINGDFLIWHKKTSSEMNTRGIATSCCSLKEVSNFASPFPRVSKR